MRYFVLRRGECSKRCLGTLLRITEDDSDALRAYVRILVRMQTVGWKFPRAAAKKRRLECDPAETAKQIIEKMVSEEIAHQLAKKQKRPKTSKKADV